jgi:hypothetical protein
MAIYLIWKSDDWEDHPIWDANEGFVVRAENEKKAREHVYANARGDEARSGWLDKKLSHCKKIAATGPAEIIMIDFNCE